MSTFRNLQVILGGKERKKTVSLPHACVWSRVKSCVIQLFNCVLLNELDENILCCNAVSAVETFGEDIKVRD